MRPSKNRIGLDVSITELNAFNGKFVAVLWERLSWVDPRLVWNPELYNKTMALNPEAVWTPALNLKNQFESNELFVSGGRRARRIPRHVGHARDV